MAEESVALVERQTLRKRTGGAVRWAAGGRLPRSRRQVSSSRLVLGTCSVLIVLIGWEMCGLLGLLDERLLPRPSTILAAGWQLATDGELAEHGAASLVTLLFGYVTALTIGIPLGLLMGRVAVMAEFFGPPIAALYAIPYLALIPVIIVAFGTGILGHGTVVFLGAFIPIVLNAQAGARGVEPSLLQVGKAFCASRVVIFLKILVPASASAILAGASLGLGRGILGVVVAELFASTRGIGNLINYHGLSLDTPALYMLVLLVGLTSFLLTRLLMTVAKSLGFEGRR